VTTLTHVDMLTRRQTVQCRFVSAGVCLVGPSLLHSRFGNEHTLFAAGTTLDSTIVPKGRLGYRRLGEGPAYPLVVRDDLAKPKKDRGARRQAKGVVVQLTDLHLTAGSRTTGSRSRRAPIATRTAASPRSRD